MFVFPFLKRSKAVHTGSTIFFQGEPGKPGPPGEAGLQGLPVSI